MTGVAGDACLSHVRLVVLIDLLCHLNHAARHHLSVLLVIRKILNIVAISTTSLWRNPLGNGGHVAVELTDAQIAQNLNVFVNVLGLGAFGVSSVWRSRCGVQRRLLGQCARVVNLLHARTTVTRLNRLDGGSFTTRQHHSSHQAKCSFKNYFHGFTPRIAGSTTTGVTNG